MSNKKIKFEHQFRLNWKEILVMILIMGTSYIIVAFVMILLLALHLK